jgi:hypothetical protein
MINGCGAVGGMGVYIRIRLPCRVYKVYAKIIAKITGKIIDPLIPEGKLGRE